LSPEIQIVKKISNNMLPPTCRVEPTYVGTFDNKTYSYEINDCKHLLFKDRSGLVPVAVLATRVAGPKSSKVVEILAGVNKIELKPKSQTEASGMTVEIEVDGVKKTLDLAHGQTVVEKSPKSGQVSVL
jgi:hypothetical protein